MPRTWGWRRSSEASMAPVPPPTSTTVRIESHPSLSSMSKSGMPCPAGPMSASNSAAIVGCAARSSQNGRPNTCW